MQLTVKFSTFLKIWLCITSSKIYLLEMMWKSNLAAAIKEGTWLKMTEKPSCKMKIWASPNIQESCKCWASNKLDRLPRQLIYSKTKIPRRSVMWSTKKLKMRKNDEIYKKEMLRHLIMVKWNEHLASERYLDSWLTLSDPQTMPSLTKRSQIWWLSRTTTASSRKPCSPSP